MEFRRGTIADLNNICTLIAAAIKTMEEQGIHQWDMNLCDWMYFQRIRMQSVCMKKTDT